MFIYDLRHVHFKDVFANFPGADDIVFDDIKVKNKLSIHHPYDVLVSFVKYINKVDGLDVKETIDVLSNLYDCINDELYINFEAH